MKKIVCLVFSVLTLSACESFTAERYVPNTENKYHIKNLNTNTKLGVSSVVFASEESLNAQCRLAGPIQVAGGSYENYFSAALIEELQNTNLYLPNSNNNISVTLDTVVVKTVSPASWDIVGQFFINDAPLTKVSSSFSYNTSFSAMGACTNAAENLPYAIEDFYSKFLQSAELASLLK